MCEQTKMYVTIVRLIGLLNVYTLHTVQEKPLQDISRDFRAFRLPWEPEKVRHVFFLKVKAVTYISVYLSI